MMHNDANNYSLRLIEKKVVVQVLIVVVLSSDRYELNF